MPPTTTDPAPIGSEVAISDADLRRAAKIATVINGIAAGLSTKDACARAGIHRHTWDRWRKEGDVQDLLQVKFEDVTAGVKDLVAESLVPSTRVLTSLARGVIPTGTSINGVLAPRDVVAAQQQLMNLWKTLGGGEDPQARENERVLDELRKRAVAISLVHIETVNVGNEAQPLPVPSGVRVIEGSAREVDGDD